MKERFTYTKKQLKVIWAISLALFLTVTPFTYIALSKDTNLTKGIITSIVAIWSIGYLYGLYYVAKKNKLFFFQK